MPEARRVVVLAGPTAAGKSALALSLARAFGGEIISADSRQIYVGMDVGTDKATPQRRPRESGDPGPRSSRGRHDRADPRLRGDDQTGIRQRHEPVHVADIPHYLIDILTPDERYSAAEFRDDARRIIVNIHARGKLPIVVGGTGFYLRVLTGGVHLPSVPPNPVFRAWADRQPLEALARELQSRAPDLAVRVDNPRNRRRVTRYLEIARARGNRQQAGGRRTRIAPPSSLPPHSWQVLKLALLPPREELRQRIEARVDDQFRRGLVDEVKRLVDEYGPDAPGLQAVGYRQVLPYLRGEQTLGDTQTAVLRAHWDYARRQRTWLKREPNLVTVATPAEGERAVRAFLAEKNAT